MRNSRCSGLNIEPHSCKGLAQPDSCTAYVKLDHNINSHIVRNAGIGVSPLPEHECAEWPP